MFKKSHWKYSGDDNVSDELLYSSYGLLLKTNHSQSDSEVEFTDAWLFFKKKKRLQKVAILISEETFQCIKVVKKEAQQNMHHFGQWRLPFIMRLLAETTVPSKSRPRAENPSVAPPTEAAFNLCEADT